MTLKTVSIPAAIAVATTFAGVADAATITTNVDYTASFEGTPITIGAAEAPQYIFQEEEGGKIYLNGQGTATVADPGSNVYENQQKTRDRLPTSLLSIQQFDEPAFPTFEPVGFDGDYGLKFAIGADQYNGTATVDTNGTHISKISYSLASAVPEPESWALMILGLGAAGAVSRRRRQQPALVAA